MISGSGYSSLNMLGKMPVDILLDMKFIQDEAAGPDDGGILRFYHGAGPVDGPERGGGRSGDQAAAGGALRRRTATMCRVLFCPSNAHK